ncbi:hypothetical protein [Rhodococcus wratislaviensis]|uniref:AbiTii domain-containing protein n=1 Tax=Rhodococcus wratislaviensis TaxID=44752 RepID=UPI000F58488C|nr:hypothetical protein [Rhodococcus wratislaviensis]
MVADAELLADLRERVLDESESLVGLLRKCLALGAVTGSDALRLWASRELKGYDAGVEVPAYRKLRLPLYLDSVSLSQIIVRRQSVSRHQAPTDAQNLIPELVSFRMSIDHLIGMAESDDTQQIRLESLKFAASKWNAWQDNDPQIVDLYYQVSDTAIGGIVGVIRTTLVEMVLDMAKDVPLHQLPTRRQADAAVHVHVGGSHDEYLVNVQDNSGVIGQGSAGTQIQHAGVPPSTGGQRQQRWGWIQRLFRG